VDDPADARATGGIDHPFKEVRGVLAETKAACRRPALRAVDDHLDGADRIGESLVICICIELDDGGFGGQGARNLIA
jgi:hypothetical protein